MKRMRNLAIILALLACGTLFAGGQKDAAKDGSGKTPLRLYTYYADTDVAIVDYAVSALKQKYPVEIEVTHRSDATGVELKTMAAVGNLPDIFRHAFPCPEIKRYSFPAPVINHYSHRRKSLRT